MDIKFSQPLVSIIIPVYNVEKYLRRCMDSIVTQTLRDIEIICVNDGTKDNSVSILNEYAQKDKRIKIIHKKNGGLSSARNEGMKYATAEYIGFVDSDDWLEPDTYELAYKAMIENSVDLVCWYAQIEVEDGCTSYHPNVYNYHVIKEIGMNQVSNELLLNTTVTAWNKLYKKEIIEKYMIQFPDGFLHEDLEFFSLYAVRCNYIFYIDKYLYHYFQRNNSICNNNKIKSKKLRLDKLKIPFRIYNYYLNNELLPKFAKYYSTILFWSFEEVYLNARLENKLKVLKFSTKMIRKINLVLLDDSYDYLFKLKNKNYLNIPCLKGTVFHFGVFSKIIKEAPYLIIFFMFIKLKINYVSINSIINKNRLLKKILNTLLSIKNILKKRVLIIEANNCHGEVIPGYIDYYKKLGYDIEVIITKELAVFKPLYMFTDNEIKLVILDKDEINKIFSDKEYLIKYTWILITSKILYRPVDNIWREFDFFSIYPLAIKYRKKIVFVQHHANLYNKNSNDKDKTIMLEKFDLGKNNEKYIVCTPFYFGNVKNKNNNSGIITFICLTLRRLMLYIYGAPILDVSRSHTTTQHSR